MKQAATLFLLLLIFIIGLNLSSTANQTANNRIAIFQPIRKESPDPEPHSQNLYHILAAEMALDREQPEIALANYIAAAKETQDAAIAARATQVALSVASLEQALEPAMVWANADKNNLEAQITLAAIYIRLNKISEAVAYLKRAESVNALEAYQYYLILFRQLQKEEDSVRVIQALEVLAKEKSKYPSAYLALGEIYLYQGNESKALHMSDTALKIDEKSAIAIQLYTEALLRVKGKTLAKEFLAQKAIQNPKNFELHQYYAQFLIDNGFKVEAKKEILKLIDNPHLQPDELIQFARIAMQAQWGDLSAKILNRTRAFPETKDISHYFLARLAETQGQYDGAIEWYKQVLTGPFHSLSQVRASILLTEKKKYREALEVLDHAKANDNGDKKQIILSIVDIYNKTKRYKEAFALLNTNIELMPEEIDLRYARSLIADHLNLFDIAEVDLKTILETQPNHIDALNALGFMLANKTTRYQEAEAYLTRALKLSPQNSSILDSIGWLYYKMGNYEKSLEILQQAAKIMPDAEIAAHLGEVMWKMKDFDGAKRVWKNALEHHPKHENVLDAMNRLMRTDNQSAKNP